MKQKYQKYLGFVPMKEDNISKHKTSTKESNTSSMQIDDGAILSGNFLDRNDIDILFPGHIKSYYASAEF